MDDYDDIYGKYDRFRVDYYPVRHRKKNLSSINVRLIQEYRTKIDAIRKMDEKLGNMILSKDDYFDIVAEAYSQNTHWSTKIEGNPLTLAEVRRSSEKFMKSACRDETDPGPVQEIYNHLLLNICKKDTMALPWDINVITSVHEAIMDKTGIECEPGMIRETEVCVYTEHGQESFIACPTMCVKEELNDLLDWVSSSPLDPILTSVVFFHEFESIHPFKDGNGRVGRSLFHILMQQLGFKRFDLCILEPKLLGKTGIYYSLLEYTDCTGNYTPIVDYFIDCIFAAYSEAVETFSAKDMIHKFDENTKAIANKARETNGWFTVSDAQGWVQGVGEQTVRTRLSDLVDEGVLEKKGKTRSTMFRFSDPFRQFKEQ